jgi:hypothetical protein
MKKIILITVLMLLTTVSIFWHKKPFTIETLYKV